MRQSIEQHEGKKYLKEIQSALPAGQEPNIHVDVYSVLTAFDVTCPATAHAIKKLLCAGQRGKGDRDADLKGAMAALNRAIDMDRRGDIENTSPVPEHGKRLSKCIEVLKKCYNIGVEGQQAIFCLETEILPFVQKSEK